MPKREPEAPKPKPWDRPLWPSKGDDNMDTLYAAVGRALSQWERYEAHLAMLFSALVTGMETDIARRAYCAVRTFEGRAEMLRAASEAYFFTYPDTGLQERFKVVIKEAKLFSERRNEITHAVLDHWQPNPPVYPLLQEPSWGLFPTAATFKNRSFEKNSPEYCYTSVEINRLYDEFNRLTGEPASIAGHILLRAKRST
jgi:hypothetical protein